MNNEKIRYHIERVTKKAIKAGEKCALDNELLNPDLLSDMIDDAIETTIDNYFTAYGIDRDEVNEYFRNQVDREIDMIEWNDDIDRLSKRKEKLWSMQSDLDWLKLSRV